MHIRLRTHWPVFGHSKRKLLFLRRIFNRLQDSGECALIVAPADQIILLMLRGRHRGLPVAIDRAILLPKSYAWTS